MELIQLEASADVLRGLHDVAGLYLVTPTTEDLGADRFRVSGYAPPELIGELEARGCDVRVLMTGPAIDEFHRDVAITVAPDADTRPPEA